MGNHGWQGVSQNAGVLVVLVVFAILKHFYNIPQELCTYFVAVWYWSILPISYRIASLALRVICYSPRCSNSPLTFMILPDISGLGFYQRRWSNTHEENSWKVYHIITIKQCAYSIGYKGISVTCIFSSYVWYRLTHLPLVLFSLQWCHISIIVSQVTSPSTVCSTVC